MCGSRINRRDMISFLGSVVAAAPFPALVEAASQPQASEAHNPAAEASQIVTPQDALARLKEGNARFAGGKSMHAHEGADLRLQLKSGQHPFATVLGCSDSRVPIEIIFDQGFGDLFVVRVAGNVITDDVLGSIEYARIHLNVPLLVILGHEECGAVTAALEARSHASSDPLGIQYIVKLIQPAIANVDATLPAPEQVHRAVESNVVWARDKLKKLAELHNLPIEIVGAVYDLEGSVRWL